VALWLHSAHFGPDRSHRSSDEFPLQDLIEFVRNLLDSVEQYRQTFPRHQRWSKVVVSVHDYERLLGTLVPT
jgi:hypothetical protein